MASSAAKVHESHTNGLRTFTVNGAVHHLMAPLAGQADGQRPAFAQLYILDEAQQLDARMQQWTSLDRDTMEVCV
jgi:hypothetical protein